MTNETAAQNDSVTIPAAEYKKLLRDSELLACLHEAGVDNWEFYGEAITCFNGSME